MSFYDGGIRPVGGKPYKEEDLKRICYNCGLPFGNHQGYGCYQEPDRTRIKRRLEDMRK